MSERIQVPTPIVATPAVVTPTIATVEEPATHNYRAVQVIWFIASVITTLIAIRFILKLLGASIQSGFVTLVYGLTDALVAPFQAIFPGATNHASTVDVASLVAIVIYALLGWGLVTAVKLMTAPKGARSIS